MEPAFQRGDILFLTNHDDPIRSGEIIVFKIKDRDIPIVHRVIKVHEKSDKKVILPFFFGKICFNFYLWVRLKF
jgi:signal peptidase